MVCTARKFVRVTKFLLAGVAVFCISWIGSVNEWQTGVRWGGTHEGSVNMRTNFPTMKTIVAFSEAKQAEMDRPSPVTCDRLPTFPNIPHINRTWTADGYKESWQHVKGTRVSLFSAYYDDRAPQRYVRILAIFQGRNYSDDRPLYCQTRSTGAKDDSIEVVTAKPLEMWWHGWDLTSSNVETPLLLSCSLTDDLFNTSVVSVVTEPCDNPTNAFLLEPTSSERRYKRKFTICVKDMNFDKDISQNLLEWIETNRILGVDLIDVYVDNLEKKTKMVLLNYRNQGHIRMFHVPIKYSSERSLWQRRRDHIITYNDCLYRNIIESEFIIPLDVDEILLPKIAFNLPDLIVRLSNYGWNPKENSAIMVQNIFFFDIMQGMHRYSSMKKNVTKDRIYMKRDDVRIQDPTEFFPNDIEITNDISNYKTNTLTDFYTKTIDLKYYEQKCINQIPVPKLFQHVISSAMVSPVGYYSKSLMLTKKVLTAFNHYPLANLGNVGFAGWPAPISEVQLNHYKDSCNSTMMPECERYRHRTRFDRTALRLRRQLTQALAAVLCSKIKTI